MKLSEVPVGVTVEVQEILQSDVSSKLRAIGIFPGVKIQVVKEAPMGDPRIYRIFKKLISLRNNEADLVEVKIIEDTPLPATFVEPGTYKIVSIDAGIMATRELNKCGIVVGSIIEILPSRKVKTNIGTFDIGWGKLAKIKVIKVKDFEKSKSM
ncbi:MAG: FeoA family protein [Fervidobacterium sp.]